MKKSRFTEQQIAFALQQAETGTSVEEVLSQARRQPSDVFPLEEGLWRINAVGGPQAEAP